MRNNGQHATLTYFTLHLTDWPYWFFLYVREKILLKVCGRLYSRAVPSNSSNASTRLQIGVE